jgi:hypothetical protein
MRLTDASVALLVALTGWFALDFLGVPQVVDREPLLSLAGLMLAVLAGVAVAGLLRLPGVAAVYALALLIWAALQVETHWATYLLWDASERKLVWYERAFGDNWRFLPVLAGRTTPDGYHTVLMALILANIASAGRDCFRR